MVWLVALILALGWTFGIANAYTAGGYLHVLIAASIVLLIFGVYRHLRRGKR